MAPTLAQILEAREARALRRKALLEDPGLPLVCFTLNIPGPQKDSPLIRRGFRLGLRLLEEALPERRSLEYRLTAAGWEAFLCVDLDPRELKRRTLWLEDRFPGGRVFDMDVAAPQGAPDRQALGLPPRQCLLCGGSARVCGRSRAHSPGQLLQKTLSLLEEGLAAAIGDLAVRALVCEVYATPKPGLVDRLGSGSHRDMDICTFLSSAAALAPYFRRCAALGLEEKDPQRLFSRLRPEGLAAEQAMYRATGGVNTHKGAVFSLGLLCAAAGALDTPEPRALCDFCAQMTRGLTRRELEGAGPAQTAGERLYRTYRVTGARGEAEAGFPGALLALEKLEESLRRGLSLNDSLCAALLTLMAQTTDTNLLHRGGMEAQQWVWQTLRRDPNPDLPRLCREFQARNLSPGGSADLLSAACFLHFVKTL